MYCRWYECVGDPFIRKLLYLIGGNDIGQLFIAFDESYDKNNCEDITLQQHGIKIGISKIKPYY